MTCPTCGSVYAYHDEYLYTCPNGHQWYECSCGAESHRLIRKRSLSVACDRVNP